MAIRLYGTTGKKIRLFGGTSTNSVIAVSESTASSSVFDRISRNESGGNYQAKGPVVQNPKSMYHGDRAYGKYQIMGKNIPSWSKQALGRSVTVEEYLRNPQIQEAIIKDQYNRAKKQGLSDSQFAAKWFSGSTNTKSQARDELGTTTQKYVEKFNAGVAPSAKSFRGGNLMPGVIGRGGVNYPTFESGYGGSFKVDEASGKPLLQKTTPQFKVAGLPDRVATTFDITKPQKLTRDVLTNGRMPLEASNAIRRELGLGLDEQLDHAISLQLGGSNLRANLQGVKETTKGVQPLVGLENELGRKVIKGEISLLEAQRELAKAKGITLKEDQPRPVSARPPIRLPSFLMGVGRAVAKPILGPVLGSEQGLKAAKGAIRFGKEGLQSIPRNVASVALSGANALTPGQAEQTIEVPKYLKPIFGTDRIKSLPLRVVEAQKKIEVSPTAKKYGLDKYALPLAMGGVIGGSALDFLPGGAGKSKLVKDIASATDPKAILKILKEGLKLSDDVAERTLPSLVKATDPGEVQKILKLAMESQGAKTIPKSLEPLATEARKYKSAEEFVKSTKAYGKQIGVTETDIPIKGLKFNQTQLDDAGSRILKEGATDANKGPIQVLYDIPTSEYRVLDGHHRLVKAIDRGDKTIRAEILYGQAGDNTRFLPNPDKLYSPSQLTDFYNQAVRGANVPPTLPKTLAGDLGPAGARTTAQGTGPGTLPKAGTPPKPGASLLAKSDSHASLSGKIPRPPQEVKAILNTSKQINEPPKLVARVVDKVKKAFTNTVEYVQNTDERVRQLVKKQGVKVDDISDPYLKATLYPGRVATKIETARKEIDGIVKDSNKVAKEFRASTATIRKEVNDYLRFRHAPERNLALGDGAAGITTKEAQEGLKALQASPRGAKIKVLADRASKLNEQTLDLLKDSGVISDELYATLRTKYKNHVPLQRVFEETEDIGQALAGKGFDVRSSGIKRAVGSSREVDDILANITTNYEQAVLRSEKNIVDQATLAFARNNKDILGDLLEVVKPKAIGQSFDGKFLMQKTNDPTILQMFENGKPVWIKINDPALAIALRGVGREKLGGLLNAIGSFTRFYSGLATRFNPEFAFPNKIRDLQETAVYLASQKGVGFKGAAKTVVRDPISVKNVFASLRGADTPGARLYEEMKSLGGTTGGMGLSTKKQVTLSLAKMEKLARSKTRRIADNLVEYVDDWNTIFEDSTRLSVYKQSLAQGLSKERAAFLAKEASINFNRMGRGGPVINALYMFSNASIQGSAKMIRSLKNPKVLGATVLAVGGSVAAVNQWNDNIDPDWRDKVSKWDRLNGLPVVLPSAEGEGIKYITIPVSWGLKPIKVMTDYAYDAVSGQNFSAKNMMNDTMTAILEAYNPTGGSDLVSSLTPTFLDVPAEISRNQSWSGSKIKPDYDPNAPEDIKYFDSLKETTSGRVSISISELLVEKTDIAISPADIKYAFDAYVGGAGRAVSKTVNVMTGPAKGDPAPLDEYPFISRFYREKAEEELGTGSGPAKQEISELTGDAKRESFKAKEAFRPKYEEIRALVDAGQIDEAKSMLNALSDEEYEAYKSLKTSDTRRENTEMEVKIYDRFKEIRALVDAGNEDEARALLEELTDEEYEAYQRLKNKLVQ